MIKNMILIAITIISWFLVIDRQINKDLNAKKQYEQQLEECFKQEVKTKDCEFFLWKHNRRCQ